MLLALSWALSVLLATFIPNDSWPKPNPFSCYWDPPTLRREIASCDHVVTGRVKVVRGEGDEGSCEFVVAEPIKGTRFLRGSVVTFPCNADRMRKNAGKDYLVLLDLNKNQFQAYRGVEATPDLAEYARGLAQAGTSNRDAALRFCFTYLGHADKAIDDDAAAEFHQLSSAELRFVARKLSPQPLRRLVANEKAESRNLGLYAYLLGNCGNASDAALLRKRLNDGSGSDLLLTGYTLLAPKDGCKRIRALVADPKTDFNHRYRALRSVRTLREQHAGTIEGGQILDFMGHLLGQWDICDLVIEDLRKWEEWKHTKQILEMHGKMEFKHGIIHRYILRYSLECPKPEARKFLEAQRKSNPQDVLDQEEMLRLMAPEAKPAPQ